VAKQATVAHQHQFGVVCRVAGHSFVFDGAGIVSAHDRHIQIQDVLYEDEPSIDNSMLFDDHIHELLEKFDNAIDYYVPRIQNFALVATDNQTRGAMVMGIEPERELKLNDLLDDLVAGEFIESGDENILVAEGLASILNAGVGDTLVLLGQGFRGTTAAGKYRIKGIVDLNTLCTCRSKLPSGFMLPTIA